MRSFQKLTAVLLALCLTVAVLPPVCLAAGQTYTLPDLGDLEGLIDSNQVSDGDTIILEGFGHINHGDDGAPWVIRKDVTIQGGSVVLRASGIVLDANVTFRDTILSFESITRNGIFANGHELTLENVKPSNTLPYNLFCGQLIDSYAEGFPNPAPGNRGVINIRGTTQLGLNQGNQGHIFAGSFCAGNVGDTISPNVFAGDAVINLEGSSSDSWALGNVYACGAKQLRTPVSANDGLTQPVEPDENICKVSGTVSVNGRVKNVLGGGASRVDVTCRSGGSRQDVNLIDISSLTVGAGHVYVMNGSYFKDSGGAVSVPAGSTLDITELEDIITIGRFSGGGSLAMENAQTLNITGAVSGTTSVGIGGFTASGASSSVPDTRGHAYIKAPASEENSFQLSPHANNPGHKFVRDAAGDWTVSGGSTEEFDKVSSFSFDTKSVSAKLNEEAEVPMTVNNGQAPVVYMDFIPLEIYVDGSTKPAYVKEVEGTYTYTTNSPVMEMEVNANSFYVTSWEAGTFSIRVVVPAKYSSTGSAIEDTVTLTVTDGTTPPPVTVASISVSSTTHKTEYAVGDSLDVTGLAIEARLSDGTTRTVPVTADMVTGFDSSTAGQKTLTITYQGRTASYTVTVRDSGVTPPPEGQTWEVTVGNSHAQTTGAGSYRAGETVTVHAGTYGGHAFASWSATGVTLADRTRPDVSFTMPANDVSLLAVWRIEETPVPPGHTHTWSAGWTSGPTHHWHACGGADCPVTEDSGKDGYAAHTPGDWVVDQAATSSQTGSRHRACTVCGYVTERETIPATGGGSSSGGGSGSGSGGGSSSGGSSGGGSSSSSDRDSSDGSSKPANITNTTVKNSDGSTTAVSTNHSTGAVTETTRWPDGTTAAVTTSPSGQTTAEIRLPSKTVQEAQDRADSVPLPIPALSVTEGATLTLRTGSVRLLRVEIPLQDPTPGTVAVLVSPGGKETILKTAVPTGDSITISAADGAVVKLLDNRKAFTDTGGHWAGDSIDFVTARDLFSGRSSGTFAPDAPMTREMLTAVLARLDGVEASGGAAYDAGMRWAVAQGISDGRNPAGRVTREQIAAMLYRYAGEPAVGGGLSFTDAASVSGYAQKAVRWAVEQGILTGYQDRTLAPQRTATRAQVAAMLTRYIRTQADN